MLANIIFIIILISLFILVMRAFIRFIKEQREKKKLKRQLEVEELKKKILLQLNNNSSVAKEFWGSLGEEFRNKFLDTVVENIITYDNKKGKKK